MKGSLHSLVYPGTYYVDQASCKLTEIHLPLPPSAVLKGLHHHAWPLCLIFLRFWYCYETWNSLWFEIFKKFVCGRVLVVYAHVCVCFMCTPCVEARGGHGCLLCVPILSCLYIPALHPLLVTQRLHRTSIRTQVSMLLSVYIRASIWTQVSMLLVTLPLSHFFNSFFQFSLMIWIEISLKKILIYYLYSVLPISIISLLEHLCMPPLPSRFHSCFGGLDIVIYLYKTLPLWYCKATLWWQRQEPWQGRTVPCDFYCHLKVSVWLVTSD